MGKRRQIKITKQTTVKIVTSGYTDRFIMYDSYITVTMFTKFGQDVTIRVETHGKLIDFLCHIKGYSIDNAVTIPIEKTFYISGTVDPEQRHYSSMRITTADIASIQAYLTCVVHKGDGYANDYVQTMQKQLSDHPLSDNLLKIVQSQLAECDRKNTVQWGHPHGQAANRN